MEIIEQVKAYCSAKGYDFEKAQRLYRQQIGGVWYLVKHGKAGEGLTRDTEKAPEVILMIGPDGSIQETDHTEQELRAYTEAEIRALDEKEERPEAAVICPRCGDQLLFEDHGSAYRIRCKRSGCIVRTIRGF